MNCSDSQHSKTWQTITAVILTGGEGSRFGGRDKGLVVLDGMSLIERMVVQLRPMVGEIIISANRNFEVYATFGCAVVSDAGDSFRGPLSGIATCLEHCDTPYGMSVPVDLVELPNRCIQRLMDAFDIEPELQVAVAADENGLIPTLAIYRTDIKQSARLAVSLDELSVQKFQRGCLHRVIRFDGWYASNINHPGDLAKHQNSAI